MFYILYDLCIIFLFFTKKSVKDKEMNDILHSVSTTCFTAAASEIPSNVSFSIVDI